MTEGDLSAQLPVVLVGLPGAGKSRVGEKLATALNAEHLDTDRMVEESTGMSISEIFRTRGEAWFRDEEAAALVKALGRQAVISIGGGAVETPLVRELLAPVTVVHIQVELDELLSRVKRSDKRPLLRKAPEKTLATLHERRTPLYREVSTVEVRSSREPVDQVVRQIITHLGAVDRIRVAADPAYPVIVGSGVTADAVQQIPADVRRVLLVRPAALESAADRLARLLRGRDIQVSEFVHPEGEAAKDISVAASGWDRLGDESFGRRDLVVTLGGGASTDLGGFLAATWMRGIRVAHFPTSLLAMVDAAIGGKTGINASAGKNLIGSFHNPLFVCSDLDYLQTLPPREYAAGLGEVVKAGFIADPRILELIERHPEVADQEWAIGPGGDTLRELIARSVRVKAEVVAADFREGGLREILNYGHTLAHAIEKASNYSVRHGEAVSIGCVFAAELAAVMGMIDRDLVEQHRRYFSAMNLPIDFQGHAKLLVDLMYSDKKTRGDQLRFVLLSDIGKAGTYPVERELVEQVADSSGVIHR